MVILHGQHVLKKTTSDKETTEENYKNNNFLKIYRSYKSTL